MDMKPAKRAPAKKAGTPKARPSPAKHPDPSAAPIQRIWQKLGYATESELLYHFPRRYEDRSRWLDPFTVEDGDWVTSRGKIVKTKFSRWRGGKICFEAVMQPQGTFHALQLVWFNMPFLKTSLVEGKELIVHGKIQVQKDKRKLTHPEFEIIRHEEDPNIHLNRVTPVYPLTEGVGQRQLRRTLFKLIQNKMPVLDETHPVPPDFPLLQQAMMEIHFPESFWSLELARKRLAFDELFSMQVLLADRRRRARAHRKLRPPAARSLVAPFLASLPYSPTGAQVRVFGEIARDLEDPRPMHRLLQGDVGSGKTLVAAHAMLHALERGFSAALLAPTETLAEQHHRNLNSLFAGLGVPVHLWTRHAKPGDAPLLEREAAVFVGTHALFQDSVRLPNLGLGVIDEQHKFGVMQRQAFLSKGDHPDLLLMTATPIPRTLCLCVYGDLDVSVLDEMPPGRIPVQTVLRTREELPKVWEYVKKENARGRQAYVVYPVLEESEKHDLKSVQAACRELQGIFGTGQVVMLHGKMDPVEKSARMRDFQQGRAGVMVATSVIEVGVDVPAATMMIVEHAERFGLAQLHQLRGRVGRGGYKSYCVLVSDAATPESWERLKVMETVQDGFQLSEEDLKIRGPGNVLGTEQSGLPPLRLANLSRDMPLLQQAREMASLLVEKDPQLKSHPGLRQHLSAFWGDAGKLSAH
jgi:ATP-dependent DNA helicase RecG